MHIEEYILRICSMYACQYLHSASLIYRNRNRAAAESARLPRLCWCAILSCAGLVGPNHVRKIPYNNARIELRVGLELRYTYLLSSAISITRRLIPLVNHVTCSSEGCRIRIRMYSIISIEAYVLFIVNSVLRFTTSTNPFLRGSYITEILVYTEWYVLCTVFCYTYT